MIIQHTERWIVMEEIDEALLSKIIGLFKNKFELFKENNVDTPIFNPGNIKYLNRTLCDFFETSDNTFVKFFK